MKRLTFLTLLASCSSADVQTLPSGAGLVLGARTAEVARSEPYQAFKSGYFPRALESRTVACGMLPVPRQPIFDSFHDDWYSKHLLAASEPKLYDRSRTEPASTSLRFTWLRSFHAPVLIRVETLGDRTRLIAKRLSGAGGYGPGEVEETVERDLTVNEIGELNRVLSDERLFDQPAANCDLGCDGAQWIFEGADVSGYHFMSRWSPENGPAKKVGDLLIKKTGWRFDEVY